MIEHNTTKEPIARHSNVETNDADVFIAMTRALTCDYTKQFTGFEKGITQLFSEYLDIKSRSKRVSDR